MAWCGATASLSPSPSQPRPAGLPDSYLPFPQPSACNDGLASHILVTGQSKAAGLPSRAAALREGDAAALSLMKKGHGLLLATPGHASVELVTSTVS